MKSKRNDFGLLVLNTFGLSFGLAGESANTSLISKSEKLLLWFLSLFAMLASILCSGLLFTEYATSLRMPKINSLADLSKNPQLEIWMPLDFHNRTEDWLKQQ